MKLKNIKTIILAVILSFSGLGTVSATVLDFEGLTAEIAEVLNTNNQGYGGFSWDEGWALYDDTIFPTPAVSGHYAILNHLGDNPIGLSYSAGDGFNFEGVWVTGWYTNQPAQFMAQGFDEFGNLVAETAFLDIIANERVYLSANFTGVSRVEFVGGGYLFSLDDFAFNTNLPEAGSIVLLGFSLLGLGLLGRRKVS